MTSTAAKTASLPDKATELGTVVGPTQAGTLLSMSARPWPSTGAPSASGSKSSADSQSSWSGDATLAYFQANPRCALKSCPRLASTPRPLRPCASGPMRWREAATTSEAIQRLMADPKPPQDPSAFKPPPAATGIFPYSSAYRRFQE